MKSLVPIGVAIPCYRYHIPALRRCLDSIEQQTVYPVSVVISCSSSYQDEIPDYDYSFPLKVIVWNEKKNAAENRNIAATELLQNEHVRFLNFFDADDEMHPRRLEIIVNSFTDPKIDIVLHSYLEGIDLKKPFPSISTFIRHKNILRRAP
jgi:glycosyltransferase involved in cell wall biosynthesis